MKRNVPVPCPYRMKYSFLILFLTVIAAASGLTAAEQIIEYEDEKITFTADYMEYDQQQNQLYGRGNFHLVQGAATLDADTATISLDNNTVHATGKVTLYDGEVEVYGQEVSYDMKAKKGKILQGVIYQRPWIIAGSHMEKINEHDTLARKARITSCDLSIPHYYISASKITMVLEEHIFALNAVLWVDDVPIFYLPAFYKSLEERSFSLDIRPGYSEREGFTVKSKLGLPLSPHSYGKLYVDYYEIKGTGGGAELNYFNQNKYKGTFYGYYIKERDIMRERWNLRAAHWQKLNDVLMLQGNLEFQSDTDFNNTYFKESYDRIVQKLKSDVAFTAQTAKTTTRMLLKREDQYDLVKDKFVAQQIFAPQISFTTNRIEIGRSRWYYTFNGSVDHTYLESDNYYRKSGNTGITFTRNYCLTRMTTFKPGLSYSEYWNDRRSADDTRDLFYGRYTGDATIRQRVTRQIDLDVTHWYTVRTDHNTIATQIHAADKGVEQNHSTLGLYASLGRNITAKLLSGYDFHKDKNEVITTYKQKIDTVTAETSIALGSGIRVFLRDNYDVYPRQNVSFSGNISVGWLRTNWNYLKSNKGTLNVYHGINHPLTAKTQFEAGTRYIASGSKGMNYDTVQFTEYVINIIRQLHCFELRIEYLKRGTDEEITFNLQLKADYVRKERLINREHEEEFYPWRKNE